jgi:hypothetical protein
MTDKLSKYENDEISDELLIFLRRNFNVTEYTPSFTSEPLKMIDFYGKSYILKGNKKFLVNKIYNITTERFDIEEKVARRTIKKFLDAIS